MKTKDELQRLYGHLSDEDIAAVITRERRLGGADLRHADELDRLWAMVEAGGFTTVGEMLKAQKRDS